MAVRFMNHLFMFWNIPGEIMNAQRLPLAGLLSGLGSHPSLVISAMIGAIGCAAAIIWIAILLGRKDDTVPVNLLLCILGGLTGWIVGILATPLDSNETAHFLTLGQAVSAFASGYLVSKLDRFFEKTLYANEAPNASAWNRVGLFAVSFLLILIVVFLNRTYVHTPVKQTAEVVFQD